MEEYELSHSKFFFVYGAIQTYVLVVLIQGFYYVCYWLETPLIERYKCLEEPWPWNEDKKEWDRLFWRSVPLYSLNVLVLGPMSLSPFYFFDLPVDLDFTQAGIPSSTKMLA